MKKKEKLKINRLPISKSTVDGLKQKSLQMAQSSVVSPVDLTPENYMACSDDGLVCCFTTVVKVIDASGQWITRYIVECYWTVTKELIRVVMV